MRCFRSATTAPKSHRPAESFWPCCQKAGRQTAWLSALPICACGPRSTHVLAAGWAHTRAVFGAWGCPPAPPGPLSSHLLRTRREVVQGCHLLGQGAQKRERGFAFHRPLFLSRAWEIFPLSHSICMTGNAFCFCELLFTQ